MSSPRPAWERFAESFRTSTARSLAVSAPVGAGLGQLVEQAAVDALRGGDSVVVVASTVVVLEQWRYRLNQHSVPVVALYGGSDLLLALEHDAGGLMQRAQVVLLTSALLTMKGQTTALASLRPGLLIVDRWRVRPDSKSAASLRPWLETSGRVIHVLDAVGPPLLEAVDEQLTYSLHDFAAERRSNCVLKVVEAGPGAAADALAVRAHRALEGAGLPVEQEASYAELHAQLIRAAATSASRASDLQATINELLDAFESGEQDPRIPALIDVVQRAQQAGRPCLVVVTAIVDGHYLASLLNDAGLHAEFGSSVSAPDDLARNTKLLRSGAVVVRTRALVEGLVLPDRTTVVWWARPARLALAQDVAAAVASRDVELVAFESEVASEAADLLATPRWQS